MFTPFKVSKNFNNEVFNPFSWMYKFRPGNKALEPFFTESSPGLIQRFKTLEEDNFVKWDNSYVEYATSVVFTFLENERYQKPAYLSILDEIYKQGLM